MSENGMDTGELACGAVRKATRPNRAVARAERLFKTVV